MRSGTLVILLLLCAGCTRTEEEPGTPGSAAQGGATGMTDSVVTLDAVLEFPAVHAVLGAVNDSDGDEYFASLEVYVEWRKENPGSSLSEHFVTFTNWIEGDFGYETVDGYLSEERILELQEGEESIAMVIDISIIGSSLAHLASTGQFPKAQWPLVSRVLDRQCDPRVDAFFVGDGSRRRAMLSAKATLEAALR